MAKLKKDPNKKHYFAEVNPKDYVDMCNRAINEGFEVLAWEKGKDKEAEKYKVASFDPGSYTVKLENAGGLLAKLSSSKLADKDIFIKIGSGKFQYFTTTIFIHNKEEKCYEFVLNRSVYKTMQRSNYRLQASSHIRIQFRIDEDTLHDGLDISAGGTAFIVPEEEAPRYEKGKVFKDCKLGLNNVKFDIPVAKVAGGWPVKDTEDKPTGELKVGVAFENISDDTEEAMFKAINGEARAEEMRKKMLEKKINNK